VALRGEGALVGWFDCDPRSEPDTNEWLAREHFPERLGVPGFRRGRRWRSENGHPRYFVLYETDTLATLSSPTYLERLNAPTEWSGRVSPSLLGMKRSACRINATAGDLDGGCAATLELAPADDAADQLQTWLARDALPTLAETAGICAAHLLEADAEISSIETAEKGLRTAPDALVRWVAVVEGQHPEALWREVGRILAEPALRARGAAEVSPVCVYRLSFALGPYD
jgi:hypothetical protein